MTQLAFSIIATVLIASSCQNSSSGSGSGDVPAIYNSDNRLEWYQSNTNLMLQDAAKSTFVMLAKSKIPTWSATSSANQSLVIKGENFGSAYQLCASEPFKDQPTAGSCSAFLVGNDLVATAGHCVTSQTDCASKLLVLDFMYSSASTNPLSTSSDKIFSCKNLVSRTQVSTGADFAILQLDRPVLGRKILKLNDQNSGAPGSSLALIGYPSGLPLKIASGGSVRSSTNPQYFVTDLDAFGGNSGSAVVNTNTGLVEGILVRGETDYVEQNGCKISKVCVGNSCKGEEVTKASAFSQIISNYTNQVPTNPSGQNIGGNTVQPNSPSWTSTLFGNSGLSSLFQGVNTRLRNCSISLSNQGIKSSTIPGQIIISLDIKSNVDQSVESKEVQVETKSINSAIISVLTSILSSTVSRCILN